MPPIFTIVTTILTIAITGLLTAILWHINHPQQRETKDGGGGDGVFGPDTSGHRSHETNDSSDGGGNSGGGDGGGGGGD